MGRSRAMAVLAATALTVGVVAARPAPSSELTATPGASSIHVSGTATIADTPALAVYDGTDAINHGVVPGTDVLQGTVVQPDPFSRTLDFTLQLGDPVPERTILPDGVFYEWSIDVAGDQFRLSAVGSNVNGLSADHEFSIWVCGEPDPQTNVADCNSSPASGTVGADTLTWHVDYNTISGSPGGRIATTGVVVKGTAPVPGVGRVTGGVLYESAIGLEHYEIARPLVRYRVLDDTTGAVVGEGEQEIVSATVDLVIDGLAGGVYDLEVDVCYGTCTTTSFPDLQVGG